MKKLILFLVALLSSVTLTSFNLDPHDRSAAVSPSSITASDHLIGTRLAPHTDDALFVILLGQSNAAGYDVMERLANANYNYKGISLLYPAQRVAQAQYTASGVVPGVMVYFKTDNPSTNQALDDGSWQPLELGVNNVQNSGAFNGVGTELALCTQLHEYTGKTIYLIKCAYPATGLASSINPPGVPGNWNNTNREIFINYFVTRALRDFRIANPTLRPRLLCLNWWQGEHDALNSISTAGYKVHHNTLSAYIEREIFSQFVTTTSARPIWNLVKLRFHETAAETNINTALTELVSENARYHLVDCAPYPKTKELTSGEASPVSVNISGNNSAGRQDDNHQSYIAQLAVGEIMAQNIIDAGLVASASIDARPVNAPRRMRIVHHNSTYCYSPALERATQLAQAA